MLSPVFITIATHLIISAAPPEETTATGKTAAQFPTTTQELLQWISSHTFRQESDYFPLPKDEQAAQELFFLPKNHISSQADFFKKVQQIVNQAKQQGNNLVIMVGENHFSQVQAEFINKLLSQVKGADSLILESIPANPNKAMSQKDLKYLLDNAHKLPPLPQANDWYDRKNAYTKMLGELKKSNPKLHVILTSDLQGLIDYHCRTGSKVAEKVIEYITKWLYFYNPSIASQKIALYKQFCKSLQIKGMNPPLQFTEQNPVFNSFVLFNTAKDVYFSQEINNALAQKSPGPKTIIVPVGNDHLHAGNLPRFIPKTANGRKTEVIRIFVDGGVEDQTYLFGQWAKKWSPDSFFAVNLTGYNYKECEFVVHLPIKEGKLPVIKQEEIPVLNNAF